MTHEPVTRADRARAFACFAGLSHVGLAVSGGADSLAIMHLAARWLEENGLKSPRVSVLTVDHGLRAESAHEVQFVGDEAGKLGLQ